MSKVWQYLHIEVVVGVILKLLFILGLTILFGILLNITVLLVTDFCSNLSDSVCFPDENTLLPEKLA